MKKINGNLFLWIPIILIILGKLYLISHTTIYWIIGIYAFYNIIGILCLCSNYKGHYITSVHMFYYWDLDNYTSFSSSIVTRDLIYNTSGDYVEESEINILTYPLPFFRLFSISCWIIYFILLLNRWFNKNLTIKLN